MPRNRLTSVYVRLCPSRRPFDHSPSAVRANGRRPGRDPGPIVTLPTVRVREIKNSPESGLMYMECLLLPSGFKRELWELLGGLAALAYVAPPPWQSRLSCPAPSVHHTGGLHGRNLLICGGEGERERDDHSEGTVQCNHAEIKLKLLTKLTISHCNSSHLC